MKSIIVIASAIIICHAAYTFFSLQNAPRAAPASVEKEISRIRQAVSTLPQKDSAPISERAKRHGLKISSIARNKLTLEGAPAAFLALLDEDIVKATLTPMSSTTLKGEIVFQEETNRATPTLDQIEIVAKRESLTVDVMPLFNSPLRAQAQTAAVPGSVASPPMIYDPPDLKYMGTIAGGRRGRSGVFKDASGLVLTASVGEKIGSWQVMKIEENAAIIAPVGNLTRTFRLGL